MKYDRILIRYGEISTKGRNRAKFIDKLKRSIKRMLTEFPKVIVESTRDRMYILLNGENGEEILQKLREIPGIQSFSPVIKSGLELEEVKEAALQLFFKKYKHGDTFKISTRRADKNYPLDTGQLNHALGSHILMNVPDLKVDVRNPSIDLHVEVRSEAIYLSSETIMGAGGMPVGSSGKAMLMLSGGIDSPVAGYMSMRRGVELEAVHFFSPPFTSERSKQKVIELAEKLSLMNGGYFTLHIVPFTAIQQLIQKQIPENYTMTATRRMMLRITDEIRRQFEGLAIITGESLGQVASQTLESMLAINDVTSTPILRPLVAMDKSEIIDIARKIDTHDISIQPYEDCCTIFVPAAPKTKPKLEKVQYYESFVDFEQLIQEAVQNIETIQIKPADASTNQIFGELF